MLTVSFQNTYPHHFVKDEHNQSPLYLCQSRVDSHVSTRRFEGGFVDIAHDRYVQNGSAEDRGRRAIVSAQAQSVRTQFEAVKAQVAFYLKMEKMA